MSDLPKGVVRPGSQEQAAEIEYLKSLLARVEPLLEQASKTGHLHGPDWARDAHHLITDIKREGELTAPRVVVSRQALDDLRKRYPEHAIRCGLMERVGGRVYIRTFSCL